MAVRRRQRYTCRALPISPEGPSPSPVRRRYRCRDGFIAIALEREAHWRALARCLGRPELAYPGSWPAATTAPPRGRLGRLLESIFAADPVAVWLRRLEAHGVPCLRASARRLKS